MYVLFLSRNRFISSASTRHYTLFAVRFFTSLEGWQSNSRAYLDRHELGAFPIAIEAQPSCGPCSRHGHFDGPLSGLLQEAWSPLRFIHLTPFVCLVPREGHTSRRHAVRR